MIRKYSPSLMQSTNREGDTSGVKQKLGPIKIYNYSNQTIDGKF